MQARESSVGCYMMGRSIGVRLVGGLSARLPGREYCSGSILKGISPAFTSKKSSTKLVQLT